MTASHQALTSEAADNADQAHTSEQTSNGQDPSVRTTLSATPTTEKPGHLCGCPACGFVQCIPISFLLFLGFPPLISLNCAFLNSPSSNTPAPNHASSSIESSSRHDRTSTETNTPPIRWVCSRCGHRLHERHLDRHWPGSLAIAGLICYPAAMFMPMISVEKLGYRQAAGVLDGSLSLITHGQWLVGGVVFLVSVILPLMKLAGLVTLCFGARYLRPRLRAQTWHLMEIMGRWGMLDVLLVALLVAVIKIGDLARHRRTRCGSIHHLSGTQFISCHDIQSHAL